MTGKSADLKNEEIIYIVNEYKNHPGANVTRGGFEYGRNGFTWLAMGSYINELKNMWIHRLIIHYQIMTRITYIKSGKP